MRRSIGPAAAKHKHRARRRLAIEPLAPRVVLSADMHFAVGELARFGSETHEQRSIDVRRDEKGTFSARDFGGRDDFEARREHGGPGSLSLHTMDRRGDAPQDYGWAPTGGRNSANFSAEPVSVQHLVVIVPQSTIAPGLLFPPSSPPPSILDRPAPLGGLSLGGGGPSRITPSTASGNASRGVSVTTVARRSAADSLDGQTLIAHALAATPRGEAAVTSARAVGYSTATTAREPGTTTDGKSATSSGLESRSSSGRAAASRADGSNSSDDDQSDEGGLIEINPKRPGSSSSAKPKDRADALRQTRRRSEADAWLSKWLRSLDQEFGKIADDLAGALGAVARRGGAAEVRESHEAFDDEGGLIELLAGGRGETGATIRAMTWAAARPTIAETNVEIDAVVRLFQAFEIATVPAVDEPSGTTDDAGDVPAEPKPEVEDAGEDGLGAHAALPGLGFATLVLGSLDGNGQREGALGERQRLAAPHSRRYASKSDRR